MTLVRDRNDRVGSKEAKACKENDIALTKSDYIIHTAGQDLLTGRNF